MAKDLVQIIRDNPGCIFEIDNDCWSCFKADTDFSADDVDVSCLAKDNDDLVKYGDGGYGSGNRYGGDVLQALAVIVGVKIQSV